MDKDKYVKWEHVEELLALIKIRDRYYEWSDNYEKHNEMVKATTARLKATAKEM